MERGIAPLDYVELQIFPSQNRYEACVCIRDMAEKVASGTLEHLLLRSPRVKELSSNTNFKILPPENADDAKWFTTTTFTRFLHVVNSPVILSIGNEITQLEETRKFQLSLSIKAEVDTTSSIDSKNDLLRAVDLRLAALKDEIVDAFDKATDARCSTKDISDLENFAHHFGAKEIRDSLQKFVEMNLFPSLKDSRNINSNKTEKHPQPSQRVKYGVSPAKAAEIERQISTDDENSSFSSEDDSEPPPVERSRTPVRSATPRRSASPMRRIQIGRSGSHRAAALTIKSLNYFPAREKPVFQTTGSNSSSDEEKPLKQNVLRMSVQDKISLFESKQKDQGSKTLVNTTTKVGANKAVLRRWSSGMTRNLPDANTKTSPESNTCTFENQISNETVSASPERVEPILEPESEEIFEKQPVEWSQQKEAELNEMFMKMMETKSHGDMIKTKKSPKEQRDHYKQKRDEKLRTDASGKKTEKEAQFKVMQRSLDERKAEIHVNKKQTTVNKPQKKSTPSSKPSVLKKPTSKPSSLPPTRKSWPSTPSPRNPTGPTSTSTTRKPQSPSTIRSTAKTEKPQPRSKSPKPTPPDAAKTQKTITAKKQPTWNKTTKTTKPPETKPSFYNKVTKKGSVVPLETKRFLRKGSGIGPGVGPVVIKTRVSETLEMGSDIKVHENQDLFTPTKCEDNKSRVESSEINSELMISPTAWVEKEEEEEIIPWKESPLQIVMSPVKIISSPRVRHSLSQMLLEDNNESDTGEWGNAPALIYQKDSPKGLKRLLKFARKAKADSHLTDWSSPSAFSEGDDDAQVQNHPRVLESHVSASGNTTKATRSFFSLSTFRGSKTNINTKEH